MTTDSAHPGWWVRSPSGWAVLAVVLAAGWCIARGPVRAINDGHDWAMVYAGARTWLRGGNPYSFDQTLSVLAASGSTVHTHATPTSFIPLYPPTTYALLSPLGLLNYKVSAWAWLVINLVAAVGLVCCAARLTELAWRTHALCVAAAAILLLAPLHSGFAKGQTALVASVLGLGGVVAADRGRGIIGGVLVGLSITLKPQLGIVFIAPAILRLDRRHLAIALATVASVTLLAVAPLQLHHPSWMADLRTNLQVFTVGGPGDPTMANGSRYQLINLHHPLHSLWDSRVLVRLIVCVVAGAVVAAGMALAVRRGRRERDTTILLLSLCAIASLMAAYHRAYDAVVLALPLAGAVSSLARHQRTRPAIAALVVMAVYFIPGPAMLRVAAVHGHIPDVMMRSRWWTLVVMPHQAWALLALAGVLLWAMAGRVTDASSPQGTAVDR